MAKQEEIREGFIKQVCLDLEEGLPIVDVATRGFNYLHSQGVVIKVDRELPESPDADYLISQYDGEKASAEDVALMHLNGIEKGKSLMLKAGYVAVESLLKEGR